MMVYLRKYKHVVVLMLLLAVGVSCEKHTSGNGNQLIKNDTLEVNSDDFNTYHAPKDIDEVRKLYTVWEQKEQHGIFKKETFDYNCQNEKNGKVTFFSHGGDLCIIEHRYNEYDHFSAIDRYYVIDGKPYFIYSREVVWSFEAEGKTKDNVKEYRGYIVNGKAVECLEKNYILRSHSDTDPDPDEIPNTIADCKNIQQLITEFERLVKFQSSKIFNCD